MLVTISLSYLIEPCKNTHLVAHDGDALPLALHLHDHRLQALHQI